jgi:Ca2+-binding RTX toxin-like protein
VATISGTSGSDTLNGTSANDTLNGLGGNDVLVASGGTDFYDGGAGTDTLDLRATTAGITLSFASGTISGAFNGTFANIERVLGGNGADSLLGAAGNQNLSARGGDDTLAGGAGVDTLWGGIGADRFFFRETGVANADSVADFASGSDKIVLDASVLSALGVNGNFAAGDARFVANSTGSAQDASDRIIYNTTTRQVLYDADGSGAGSAVLIATLQTGAVLAATDIVVEGSTPPAGGQVINGTSGNDSLVGGLGNDTINGLPGHDSIDGGAGNDSLYGGAGFDQFWISAGGAGYGDDYIDGGSESDSVVIFSGQSGVVVDLGAGTLSGGGPGGSGRATLVSIESAVGTAFDDYFAANAALRAQFNGNGGSDTLIGSEADDVLDGDYNGGVSGGRDLIEGRGGRDFIGGDGGSDTLRGGAGDDDFYMTPRSNDRSYGNDSIDGGDGRDTVIFTFAVTGVEVNLEAGTMAGGNLIGGAGASATLANVENFYGSAEGSHDRITGSSAANELRGGRGSDTLQGAGGSDTLDGGEGADRFMFRESPGPANADLITDFTSGSDKLVLDGAAHANLGASGNFAAGDVRFFAGAGAVSGHDADDRVIYNTATGQLFYDPDGSGSAVAQQIATLQGAPALVATDIFAGTEVPVEPNPYNVRILQQTGSSANRIDIAFMGDGYTASQIATDYVPDVQSLTAYLFNDTLLTEPLGRYQSFFNVHAVDVISNESGADHPGVIRDTALGAFYDGRSIGLDYQVASRVLADALSGTGLGAEMRFVAVNDPEYGGAGGPFAVYSAANSSAHGVALHEAGHQFAHLGDHYIDIGGRYPGLEPSNPDLTTDPTGAKWSHWLGYDQPGIGLIGVYEGARYSTGIYRPSQNSKMSSLSSPFDAVGREAFILEFYELVDPLDAWLDNDQTLHDVDELWVDTIDPAVIRVDWTINGTTYANAGEHISLSSLGFGAGDYTVTARAYDPTDWVRIVDRSSLEETVQWRTVNGSSGGQVINGTSGPDTLTGTAGDDTINGLDGNDLFLAGSTGGNDVINGGAGRDSIEFKERATSAITVDFGSGTITGGTSGTITFTSIERVLTGNFNDVLSGDAASQTLTGQGGSDTIWGAGGADTLWGGTGADVFVFREMGTANADRISDFASGSEKLHLDDAAFTAIGAMGNFAAADARFKANSSGTATDTNDRVVFNTSTGQLYYDADGSGSAAAPQLIATVQAGATVVATDIVVI